MFELLFKLTKILLNAGFNPNSICVVSLNLELNKVIAPTTAVTAVGIVPNVLFIVDMTDITSLAPLTTPLKNPPFKKLAYKPLTCSFN